MNIGVYAVPYLRSGNVQYATTLIAFQMLLHFFRIKFVIKRLTHKYELKRY